MDVSEFCHICKKPSDQILMLACVHDVCIECAATNYAEQTQIKGLNPNVYICQICHQQTHLDVSSVTELNSLAKSYVRTATLNKNSKSKSKSTAKNTADGLSRHRQSHSPHKKIIYFCKIHSQQQISYYCFGCHEIICPECAIHGGHKDHNVKLIKKAVTQVKNQYLEVMNKIGLSQNNMSKYKQYFLKCIKQSNQKFNRQKSIVSQQFETLRTSLHTKQKQLIKRLENIKKQNIQILTTMLEDISINYEEINKVKKSVELVLRKDQVLIFEDYKKVPDFENKVEQITKQCENISGDVSSLNTEIMQQQLISIKNNIIRFQEQYKKDTIAAAQLKYNSSKGSIKGR